MQESFKLILSAWEAQYPHGGARDIMNLVWLFVRPGVHPPQWEQIRPGHNLFLKVASYGSEWSRMQWIGATDSDGWWWTFNSVADREAFIARANAEEPPFFPGGSPLVHPQHNNNNKINRGVQRFIKRAANLYCLK